MAKKEPLYPHVLKGKEMVSGRAGRERSDFKAILRALDYFIKDEQKAAKEYRDFAERLHDMSIREGNPDIREGYPNIIIIAFQEDSHKEKLENIRTGISRVLAELEKSGR